MVEKKQHKKIVVYVPHQDHLELRVKLLKVGKTVSGWFREQVTLFLNF